MQGLLSRMLTFPVPTIAVLKGHVYAGGLILALCSDFRVMKADSGKICLSELAVGLAVPPAYNTLLTTLMPI